MMYRHHDIPGPRASHGFTLIELMISITLASLLSLAVIAAYSNQAATFVNQGRSNQATEDGRDAFTVLSGLIRQAITSTLTINQSATQTIIDFQIPPGFPVWPNTTAPYDRNAIRILWSNTGAAANQIRIASATSLGALPAAPLVTLVGSTAGANTRITHLPLTPQVPAGYLRALASRSGATPPGQTTTGTRFEGIIIPRN